MEQQDADLRAKLIEMANAAEPYTKEELRIYDGEENVERMLATMARYALEHPNPKLKRNQDKK